MKGEKDDAAYRPQQKRARLISRLPDIEELAAHRMEVGEAKHGRPLKEAGYGLASEAAEEGADFWNYLAALIEERMIAGAGDLETTALFASREHLRAAYVALGLSLEYRNQGR